MNPFCKIYVALPALREFENIEKMINLIFSQSFKNIELVICINQPNSWWKDISKIEDCIDNQKTIALCRSFTHLPITIIDKSSEGNGWDEKKKGVGQARKTIFDFICTKAQNSDLIISLDADTSFSINYFQSVRAQFISFPNSIGMAVPYYHPLTKNEKINRAILRYEIYMRYYLLNLLRIKSPYAFTALGSSMVFPVWAYKKVNGMSALEAGEDFYFMQKLSKTGNLLLWNNSEKVFPSSRISNRVPFGTGPSVQKGINNNWESYPFYNYTLFDEINETYKLFPILFNRETETPLTPFLTTLLKTNDIWLPLRKNFKTQKLFIQACHERLNGLRILQFLKQNHNSSITDEQNLKEFSAIFLPNLNDIMSKLSFQDSSIEELNQLRMAFEDKELEMRYAHDYLKSIF